MSTSGFLAQLRQHLVVGTTLVAFTANLSAPLSAAAQTPAEKRTASPIEHVIVIIGENRSFDHVFATYVPKSGDRINNLLSEGIIKLDANKNAIPGPNFNQAQQFFATDTDTFLLSPPTQEYPNNTLPAPLVGGPSGQFGYFSSVPACPTLPTFLRPSVLKSRNPDCRQARVRPWLAAAQGKRVTRPMSASTTSHR